MDLGLQGKVAVVAAASKGLGRACARELAREGARVVICARDAAALQATRDALAAETGAEVLAVPADMTQAADIERVVAEAVRQFGALHIVVTNAGGPPAGYFLEFDDATWQAAVNLTLLSAVRLIRAALPHLKHAGWGRIINITSVSVKEPIDNLVLSNSIRAAVHGLAKTLAAQVAADGITVNNVMPGYIQTDRINQLAAITAKNTGKPVDEVIADLGKPVPVGRVGRPEELAAVVAFLASERASYITGHSLPVDGGRIRAAF